MCVSHDWKSADSWEDAISMLSIQFMAVVTGSAGCIKKKKKMNITKK